MQEHTKAQVHDANNNDRGKPFERKSLGRWTDKSESPNFPFLGYPFQKQTTRLKEKENAPMTQDTHQFDNQTYQRWWKSTGRTSSHPRENQNEQSKGEHITKQNQQEHRMYQIPAHPFHPYQQPEMMWNQNYHQNVYPIQDY